jgi:SAM-dependent methyltransferase
MRASAQKEIEANKALRSRAERRRPSAHPDVVSDRCSGGSTLVDIGCGSGALLRQVRDRYDLLVGIDFIPLRRPEFDKSLLVRADLRDGIPLANSVADTVTATELIEHIAEPAGLVREVFRIARPGAEAIFTTPNVRYVRHLFRLVIQGRGPRTSGACHDDVLWDGGHIHYFTAKDVMALLRKAGFVSVEASALIQANGFLPAVRRLASRWPGNPMVRELLTGRLMITGRKPEGTTR